MAVEQAVDQVQVARTTAAGAHGQLAGQMRLGARREGRALLMAHVDPLDRLLSPQRIGEAVQGVADNAVDALNANVAEHVGNQIRRRGGHRLELSRLGWVSEGQFGSF